MASSPKITILSERLRGKTFELTKDLYTVGRIEERDICIADPTISTYHCSFTKNGGTYILKDNNSTNGTRVNNTPIVEQELQNSDIVQMGDVEMLYYCEDKASQTLTTTETRINLTDNMSSSATVAKMDPISAIGNEQAEAHDKKSQKIIFICLGALVLVIVALVAWLFLKIFKVL